MSSKLIFVIRFLLSKLLRISFLCFYVFFINLFVLVYFWREVTSFSHSQLRKYQVFSILFTYFHINCYFLTLRFQLILYFSGYESGRITNFSLDYSIFFLNTYSFSTLLKVRIKMNRYFLYRISIF